jgi:hypothetical protein
VGLATIAVNKLSSAQSTPTVAVMHVISSCACLALQSINLTPPQMAICSFIRMHHLPVNQVHLHGWRRYTCWATSQRLGPDLPRHPYWLLVSSCRLLQQCGLKQNMVAHFMLLRRAVPLRNIFKCCYTAALRPTTDVITDNAVATA